MTTPPRPLNRSLHAAKATKQDEFYTQLPDIEKELKHYTRHFKGKTVLCNCDDPKVSNFFRFFALNFETLKLKKLITTCYRNADADLFSTHTGERGLFLEYEGDRNGNRVPDPEEIDLRPFKGDGDFRSPECIELLKEADIVVTNPPFSLFREYVGQLMEHKKKFVIIGSMNAITYKEIFALIKGNVLWLGNGFDRGNAYFETPPGREYASGVFDPETGLVKFRNVTWFTNLDIKKRHDELILFSKYSRDQYPSYANYEAIEVSKTKDIPVDFDGAMGVPISFLDRYNPKQFEILGSSRELGRRMSEVAKKGTYVQGGPRFYLANGDGTYRRMYDRLVIKRKK